MSILDKYIEIKANNATKKNPNEAVFKRIWDPDFLTPDDFFVMDEIGKRQILRGYNKASGTPEYIGTYHIIYKTTDMDKFCLIMRRVKDEKKIPEEYAERAKEERKAFIIAEYYPGTHGRIYLKGLGGPAIDRIIRKYERKTRKKLTMSEIEE
ncbi:MAG: hypothetical protein IJL99_03505 [Firmicutes bacterium]|nr:hypothetical protein [Bacillota bacterium]